MQYFIVSECAIVGTFVKNSKTTTKGQSFHISNILTTDNKGFWQFKLGFQNGPGLADKFLSIKSDLDPVVEEGKEGGEGEGGDEDGDEAELENHLEVLLEQALVVHQPVVGVDLREPFPTEVGLQLFGIKRKLVVKLKLQ